MEQLKIDTGSEEQVAWTILEGVPDPEIPAVSIVDLGIARDVNVVIPGEHISITITPTYSGCPAMEIIRSGVRLTFLSHGYKKVDVVNALSPAWTTDWITEEGRKKLKEYGVAPPGRRISREIFQVEEAVQCPQCNSQNTRLLSEFGSTSCKSLYQCNDCKEPFDAFKCH